ncbi:MAG: hypothetical protein J5725_03615 [Bacteroidales bacterium]|nr:hypothetical protein [Bacteroidales bacterium]
MDETYFHPYEKEFNFIQDHFSKYKVVPDVETFVAEFPDFSIFECNEPEQYLLDAMNEERLYSLAVPIIQRSADILRGNSNDAVEFLMGKLPSLNRQIGIKTTDIIAQAQERFASYEKKLNGDDRDFCITTGFREMDDVIHGFSRGEELVVLFARTNQGKSWVLTKMLTHAWQIGMNVGFVSPEMSADKIGYRFDTIYKHFNNSALDWGKPCDGYEDYVKELSSRSNKFCVSTPMDFGNEITVNKLRTFVEINKIDILGIDGISYIIDKRKNKFDNRQAELTHISEDLFALSLELKIPIIIVVQANRDGVKVNGGNLELENIRDADGIAYNASKVIAIRQKADEEILQLTIKKNRNGMVGGKFIYHWKPATGEFEYIPSEDDGVDTGNREEAMRKNEEKFGNERKVVF